MAGPAQVDSAVKQQQPHALGILTGIKNNHPQRTIGARSRKSSRDLCRAAREFGACGHIECVQTLVIGAGLILRHANQKHGPVRTGVAINYRRVGNPYLRRNLAAPVVVARGFIRAQD